MPRPAAPPQTAEHFTWPAKPAHVSAQPAHISAQPAHIGRILVVLAVESSMCVSVPPMCARSGVMCVVVEPAHISAQAAHIGGWAAHIGWILVVLAVESSMCVSVPPMCARSGVMCAGAFGATRVARAAGLLLDEFDEGSEGRFRMDERHRCPS